MLLAPFRSKAAGLPDLLPYAALVNNGTVLNKDGSLLAGFFFRGEDAASATAAERNYLTAQANQYLSRFGAGWAMWVDATRVPSPGYVSSDSRFPDGVTAMIDAERRALFEGWGNVYETEYALLLQYLPPTRRNARLGELVYDDDGRDDSQPADRILHDFERRLTDFEDGLGDLLNMRRMCTLTVGEGDNAFFSDELVNYLHFALTNEQVNLRIPDCPMYLDSWLGFPELWPGDTPKLGDQFISCVNLEGFPGVSYPGILDTLDGLPLPYRWSSRFIFLDQHEAIAMLSRYRLKWQQQIRGFWSQVFKSQKGMINTDALAMTKQSEAAINDARSGKVAYGYYTSLVVLMHPDRQELEEHARTVRREIERQGFAARIETVNTMEAWLGSLSGQTYPNVRRPPIHTLHLADLLPTTSVWPGLKENPCALYPPQSPPLAYTVTTGATPFRLNLHVGDVGHTLAFGPTGAGKSTLLALLAALFRRNHSRPRLDGSILPANIVAFDKRRSLYTLCMAAGGTHYDLGADDADTLALTPLLDLDSPSARLWAKEWIFTCFQLQANKPASVEQKTKIHQAVNLLSEAPREHRSLTDFVATVQDLEVRETLNHYTIEGPMGHLLDGKEDRLTLSSFTVFELDELMGLGDVNAIPVLLYLFRCFEQSMVGQPSLLSLDEAWVMLGHPVFREKIREWLKELRKQNCAVVIATQSLSDAVNSGLLDVLIEQCPTKILLPNKEADLHGTKETPGPADLYAMFGLNQREIEILKNAHYKRHYYYKSELGRRLFDLGLGPLTLAFVGVSAPEDLAEVRHFIATHGPDWPLSWLKHKGVDYEPHLEAYRQAA